MIENDDFVLSAPVKDNIPLWMDLNYEEVVPFVKLKRYVMTKSPSKSTTSSSSSSSSGSYGPEVRVNEWTCKSVTEVSKQHLEFPVINPKVAGLKVSAVM